MNEVIDKLAEIEEAAVKITENTNAGKAKIAKESEQKIKEFDRNFQKKLDGKIKDLKEKNQKEVQSEIKRMQQDGIREIEKLEERYQESHEQMAKDIVDALTGV